MSNLFWPLAPFRCILSLRYVYFFLISAKSWFCRYPLCHNSKKKIFWSYIAKEASFEVASGYEDGLAKKFFFDFLTKFYERNLPKLVRNVKKIFWQKSPYPIIYLCTGNSYCLAGNKNFSSHYISIYCKVFQNEFKF